MTGPEILISCLKLVNNLNEYTEHKHNMKDLRNVHLHGIMLMVLSRELAMQDGIAICPQCLTLCIYFHTEILCRPWHWCLQGLKQLKRRILRLGIAITIEMSIAWLTCQSLMPLNSCNAWNLELRQKAIRLCATIATTLSSRSLCHLPVSHLPWSCMGTSRGYSIIVTALCVDLVTAISTWKAMPILKLFATLFWLFCFTNKLFYWPLLR